MTRLQDQHRDYYEQLRASLFIHPGSIGEINPARLHMKKANGAR